MPFDPYWTGYVLEQYTQIRSIGEALDLLKFSKSRDCPVGGPDDPRMPGDSYQNSLTFLVDVLDEALKRFGKSIDTMTENSPASFEELDKYWIESPKAAQDIYDKLEKYRDTLEEFVPRFAHISLDIDSVPSPQDPVTDPEEINVIRLAAFIDDAQSDGLGNAVFESDARSEFIRNWGNVLKAALDGITPMDDAMVWTSESVSEGAFRDLIADLQPEAQSTMELESNEQVDVETDGEVEGDEAEPGNLAESYTQIAIEEQLGFQLDNGGGVVGDNNQNGPINIEGTEQDSVFDLPEVFDRAGQWFNCWREAAIMIGQRTEDLGPVSYPPTWTMIEE
ncbi:hypothetical protein ABW20_dc0108377 [Dactylellina cionopaga]|nr:hypothetical protein ABW20_dc0108377 [Dactylellina cionopaga]